MATAGAKVIVGCKIPIAWFDMQLCDERTVMEDTQTGPREVKRFVRTGNLVRIRGTAYPRGTAPLGFPDRPQTVNGFTVTTNVDKEFWDKWVSQNAKSPFVLNSMIVAADSVDALRGKTRDHKDELTGLEPVSPENDPRMPKPTLKGIEPVASARTLEAAA